MISFFLVSDSQSSLTFGYVSYSNYIFYFNVSQVCVKICIKRDD